MRPNLRWLLSTEGKQTYDLLGNVMDWDFNDRHTIVHKPTGLELWVSNGVWFFTGWGEWPRRLNGRSDLSPFRLGLRDRFILWPVYKRALSTQRSILLLRSASE